MNKQDLFNEEYFEGGGYKNGYNWKSIGLYVKLIANSVNNAFRPQRVLDIGCAKGYLVRFFKELNLDAYGVDVSSYAISQAPEEVRTNLYNLDIEEESLPFPDNFFDLITMLEVLEHLNSFGHLMTEVKRILKNDGYVLVTTPTPKGRDANIDETHINLQTKRFWVKLFNSYGLTLVNDDTWMCFRAVFLREFKKLMPQNPPSTKISNFLMKMGKIGNTIRNNTIPYLDYFSPFRSHEILLFRKA